MERLKTASLFIIVVLATVCLAACGGGADGSASGAGKSVYLMTKSTSYNPDGTVSIEVNKEYDEQGNLTKSVYDYKNMTLGIVETEYSDFDEHGYPKTITQTDGSGEARTVLHEYTIENGHAVKESSNGVSVEYEYYADGKLKSTKSNGGNQKTSRQYNEKGLPTQWLTEAEDFTKETIFEWEFDDKGYVKSYTSTIKMREIKDMPTKYDVECDENGNVILASRDGVLANKYEYVRIDNPSKFAWISSWHSWF